jgi:hypothetical protein
MAALEHRLRAIIAAARAGEPASGGAATAAALQADFAEAASSLRAMLGG